MILDDILAAKRDELAAERAEVPLRRMMELADAATPTRNFVAALRAAAEPGRPALIAEIKKASPSKGLIRADFDPPALARAYEKGGAACLSVLTDRRFFQGVPEHLTAARVACDLPLLRKDFTIDPYQVYQARAIGADAVLLIAAALPDSMVAYLADLCRELDLAALVEVHTEAELEVVRPLIEDGLIDLVGINNRDLRTFETRLEVTERLAPLVPSGPLVVSESGIFTPADLDRLAACGVDAVLVGESLMRQADVAVATRALLGGQSA